MSGKKGAQGNHHGTTHPDEKMGGEAVRQNGWTSNMRQSAKKRAAKKRRARDKEIEL